MRLRVLQLAPLWERVPPPAYGGTEAVVSVLVEELVRRNVDVTLCASGDSLTKAHLFSSYRQSLRTADHIVDPSPYDWMHVARSLREASRGYDIIHNHAGELGMAMGQLVDVPMLTTMHCEITPDTRFVWDRYEGWYNTISVAQRACMPPDVGGRYLGAVHNAIDVESFPFSAEKGEDLLFLSRVSPEKGTHIAIELAKRTKRRLLIAGKVDKRDTKYYEDVVRPLIDGEQIVYVGEAVAETKRELYARARCLVLPLLWEEPFGLVMAEAMACGTPVVAFRRGSAPEVIADGETGYLVDDIDGMVDAVEAVSHIDPARCRAHVASAFSPQLMAQRYVSTYETVLRQSRRVPQVPLPASRARTPVSGRSRDGAGEVAIA